MCADDPLRLLEMGDGASEGVGSGRRGFGPRGDGWIGLAPTHSRCWEVVVEYMDELARDRAEGLVW